MTPTSSFQRAVSALPSFAVLLVVAGCGKAAPPAPPPPEVSIVAVTPHTVDEVPEFVGSVEAFRSVAVRAKVDGIIVARPFTEGRSVRQGELLYKIDPVTYQADYRGAQARLEQAEARVANSEANLQRLTPLLDDNAISKQDYDNAVAEARQARAAVEDARATVDRTRKDFSDTEVRAEIAGRVGRTNLEIGARVRGADDVLTTIDVLDPAYVVFSPTTQQLLAWRRDQRTSRVLSPGGNVRVEVVLPDGAPLPIQGRIDFIDPVLDPSTGAQQFRATFRNADRLLLPGQFVRVRLRGLVRDSAILVPQRAVLQQLGRQMVYVVEKGDTVRARDVQATGWNGDQWLVEKGLAAGDRVVVDGVQKIGPGLAVRPVPLADSATAAVARPKPETTGGSR